MFCMIMEFELEILTLFRSFRNFLSSLENDPSRIIEKQAKLYEIGITIGIYLK